MLTPTALHVTESKLGYDYIARVRTAGDNRNGT